MIVSRIPRAASPDLSKCLAFSSAGEFTLALKESPYDRGWNGTVEWTNGANGWQEWDGTTTLSSVGGKLYLRGTANTVISGEAAIGFVLTGSGVSCAGNIENLLDYATAAAGNHPEMGEWCFAGLFADCAALASAPELPATELTRSCYQSMFSGCTGLTVPPALPAATVTYQCCFGMFYGCTGLARLPALPALTLADACYQSMFNGCSALLLSATKTGAYQYAFRVPASGTGVTADNALTYMFDDTGGTFTGTPNINTTYYTTQPLVT